MKNSLVLASLAVSVLAAAAAVAASSPPRMQPDAKFLKTGDSRKFQVTYVAHVKDVPAGAKRLRFWIPVPQDTSLQTITDVSFDGAKPAIGTESKYGDKVAYLEIADPKPSLEVTMKFVCTRKELVTDLSKLGGDAPETDASVKAFLGDENVTIVDDAVRKTAGEITAGKKTTVEKARAIYDYVLGKMTYDKTAPGWGNGDTKRAFEVCKGNCTDFHAMFMSLCRASGIPAGFEIGLFLPYERGKKDEKLGGYHCWSYFRVPGTTWVPVDISEASKLKKDDPAKADYFFGAHTSNRVTLSVGRDIVLEPPQAGKPLNYFLSPYAEADGKPVTTSKDWSFEDL
jgi:transglutaminase-like putative cysteine protease